MLPNDGAVEDFEVEQELEQLGRRVMILNAHRMERRGRTDRILLAIDDITEQEHTRWLLEGEKEYAEKIVDASRDALLILDWDLRVKTANETFYETFQVDPAGTEGQMIWELGNGQGHPKAAPAARGRAARQRRLRRLRGRARLSRDRAAHHGAERTPRRST